MVHGGAGSLPEDADGVRAALTEALAAGHAALDGGGGALDAVQAAVEVLEDDPRFNAGRGAVLNADGVVELDASVMDGETLAAGAVAAVRTVRHPVALARAVVEHTPHVLLAADGAERLADARGLRREDPAWFVTERQRERWASDAATVGAVALDAQGHLAAATSTGGVRGQQAGRIGDSPLIGCGTYAEDGACAVSATGDGEALIRVVATHEVRSLVLYRGVGLAEACRAVLVERVGALGGTGGLIAVGASGEVAMEFTTAAMARGVQIAGQAPHVALGPERA